MAESIKTNEEHLEEKFLAFLKERIGRNGSLSIKNLTGHLSALSPHIRDHFGASRSCLKQFLAEHPEHFHVDKKENVKIAVKKESPKPVEKPESNHSSSVTESSQDSESHDVPPSTKLPMELVGVHGKVYRLFPAFGFISITSPISCSVYFNFTCVENAKGYQSMDGASDISIGEGVYLNAKKGPDNVEAQYRATKVWRIDQSTRSKTLSESSANRSDLSSPVPGSTSKGGTSRKKVISGSGRIDKLFVKYGFIAQNKSLKDNVFFHVKTFHLQGVKLITDLSDVLSVGDRVKFNAVSTEHKNANVGYQATKVWLDTGEGMEDNEIYFSSLEGSVCSGSIESLPLIGTVPVRNPSPKVKTKPTDQLNGFSTRRKNSDDHVEAVSSSSSNMKSPSTIHTGTIWPHSERMADISFGQDQKALALVNVFYQCEERIDNFLWELEDGQRIQFQAVEDTSWAPEYPWKATLAWVGRKPEAVPVALSSLKEIYCKLQGETLESINWGDLENEPSDEKDGDGEFEGEKTELTNYAHTAKNNHVEEGHGSDLLTNSGGGIVVPVVLDSIPVVESVIAEVLPLPTQDGYMAVHSPVVPYPAVQEISLPLHFNPVPPVAAYVDPQPVQIPVSPVLERRVEELTLLVHELLRRVPPAKSFHNQSTQTELSTNARPHGPLTNENETQTISTGPLMYSQLYYSQ